MLPQNYKTPGPSLAVGMREGRGGGGGERGAQDGMGEILLGKSLWSKKLLELA